MTKRSKICKKIIANHWQLDINWIEMVKNPKNNDKSPKILKKSWNWQKIMKKIGWNLLKIGIK